MRALLPDGPILKKLRKFATEGINPSQRSPLIQAIRAGVIDFEISWDPARYAKQQIHEGELFSKKERNDLERRIYHNIRGLLGL